MATIGSFPIDFNRSPNALYYDYALQAAWLAGSQWIPDPDYALHNDPVIYEMAGSVAVFQDDYKLMRNNPPFGDRKWRLYRLSDDPLETKDLAHAQPQRVVEMQAAYQRYAKQVRLIEVPEDYNPITQVQKNAARNQGKEKLEKVPVLD